MTNNNNKISLEIARKSKAWPFVEAIKLYDYLDGKTPEKGYVLFETGYGPSGLPHIGTFGEVKRTTMVMNAFQAICDIPVKLICFSDDLDGLRKVPTNIPNKKLIEQNLGKPLSIIPDPFEKEESFAAYMNKKLRLFLDKFGFEYEFYSATKMYKSGAFDDILIKLLHRYEKIMDIMLPTLGEERQKTYSPFMPICKETGKVLQVKINKIDKEKNLIFYTDPDTNEEVSTIVTGGNCKLQWKPDFGMRWAKLDVDYEMYGKDHMPNAKVYSDICRVLDGKPPAQFFFELFLDDKGQKISKSSGNSISIDEWLHYGTRESISLFMYQNPTRAKRMFFDVIPKNIDEYLIFVEKFHAEEDLEKKMNNPVYHIHNGDVPVINTYGISFALLINLSSVCNPDSKDILWNFINHYNKDATKENSPYLDKMVDGAINYYNDFVKPNKNYITPNNEQKEILSKLMNLLDGLKDQAQNITPAELQNEIYTLGREEVGKENLKLFFKNIYQTILGQDMGPRLGSFFKLYGIENSIKLINNIINK